MTNNKVTRLDTGKDSDAGFQSTLHNLASVDFTGQQLSTKSYVRKFSCIKRVSYLEGLLLKQSMI